MSAPACIFCGGNWNLYSTDGEWWHSHCRQGARIRELEAKLARAEERWKRLRDWVKDDTEVWHINDILDDIERETGGEERES